MMIRHLLLVVVVALCVTAGQSRSTAAVNVVRELLNLLDNQAVSKRSCECPDWEAVDWEADPTTFTCENGVVLDDARWVDDGMDDCGDCSDEPACTAECEQHTDPENPWVIATCWHEEHREDTEYSEEIDSSEMDDPDDREEAVAEGSCECPNWEAMEADWEAMEAQWETSWPAPCGETDSCFTCDNGDEIEPDWVNDAMDDCGDCSDERECGECEANSNWMDDCYGAGDAEGEPTGAICVCLAFAAIPWDDEDIAGAIMDAIPDPCMEAMEADCYVTVDTDGDLDWEDEAAVETAFVAAYGVDAIADAEAMGQDMLADIEANGMPGPASGPVPGTFTELKRRITAMKRGIAAMKRGEPAGADCVCLAFAAIPWDDEDMAWAIMDAIPDPCMEAMEADCYVTVDPYGDLDWEDEAAVETAFVAAYGEDAIADAEAMGQEMLADIEANGMPGPAPGPGSGTFPDRRIAAMKRGLAAMKRGGEQGKPLAKKRGQGDKPLGQKRGQGDKPLAQKRGQGDKPLAQKRGQGDKPLAQKRGQGDKPLAQKRGQGDKPLAQKRGQGDKPLAQKRGQGDKPPAQKRYTELKRRLVSMRGK